MLLDDQNLNKLKLIIVNHLNNFVDFLANIFQNLDLRIFLTNREVN